MRRSENGCDCTAVHQEIVDKVKDEMISEERVTEITKFFSIFGDLTRMRILLALDKGEMCVNDLAVVMNMTKSVVSHQLKILKEYQLVKSRKSGRNSFYYLSDDHVRQIVEMAVEHLGVDD